ncbi:MAG: acyltransferase domain-containing protein [Candidatus Brocadia sp.]|nr:acyltransferase domain-containing protein [Candidatus Brocadia sp.]
MSLLHHWDTEVFILQGESRHDLTKAAGRLCRFISNNPALELKDLAFTLNCPLQESGCRLAIVANSLQDLEKKLDHSLKQLANPRCNRIKDKSGIFFFEEPLSREGTLAFLFPGEGSQYVNMLADLYHHFQDVRDCFDRIDRAFLNNKRDILPSQIVFPLPHAHSSGINSSEQILWQMDFAVAAVFIVNQALFTILDHLEIRPDAMVGHSSGEFVALMASGAVNIQSEEQVIQLALDLLRIHESLGKQIPEARLLAVGAANPSVVNSVVAESGGLLHMAMDNCPHQVVLCGSEATIASVTNRLQSQGAICNLLPFHRAYHTPSFKPVCDQFFPFFQTLKIVSPRIPVYSCATAQSHQDDPEEIRRLAVEQWCRPVRFHETINAMYADGVRIFVEVGPRGNLTSFVDDILQNRRYIAVPSNVSQRSGITQINYMIGLLATHGVRMRLDYLYAHRVPKRLSLFETQSPYKRDTPDQASLPLPVTNNKPSVQTTQKNDLQSQHGTRSKAMLDYLQTMERFLTAQQEIMSAFLARQDKTPDDTMISVPWPQLVSHLPPSLGFQCCRVSETGDERLLHPLIPGILSHRELEVWLRLSGPEKRRKEWLLGRLAAKDAVRLFLKDQYQLKANPADIEITTDRHGRPLAGGELIGRLDCRLTISITHSERSAAAVAGKRGNHLGVGVDMEPVGQNHEGLERIALSSKEQTLLSAVPVSKREQWLLRLWCAKEAVAKALGRGMTGNPLNLFVQKIDAESGEVSLALSGELARQLNDYKDMSFTAYTRHDGDFIFAISIV